MRKGSQNCRLLVSKIAIFGAVSIFCVVGMVYLNHTKSAARSNLIEFASSVSMSASRIAMNADLAACGEPGVVAGMRQDFGLMREAALKIGIGREVYDGIPGDIATLVGVCRSGAVSAAHTDPAAIAAMGRIKRAASLAVMFGTSRRMAT